MKDVDAFLSSVLPQVKGEVEGIHSGNVAPRMALWSHQEPVTVFGAAATWRGWNEIETGSRRLAANFHGSESCEYEVLAAGVSGDLGYVAGIEHSVAAVGDADPAPFALRVTTVLRREDGLWKIVHRHADPYDASATDRRNAVRSGLNAASTAPPQNTPAGSGAEETS